MKIEKELSEIRQVYAETDASGKALMEKLYSKIVLGDVRGRIKSFELACQELNRDPEVYDESFAGMQPDEITYIQLKVIAEALNEGWKPDWSNQNEKKWYPWFVFRGGRFVFYDVIYLYTYSHLGSRLCFRTAELAKYAGTQFEDLYNEFLN